MFRLSCAALVSLTLFACGPQFESEADVGGEDGVAEPNGMLDDVIGEDAAALQSPCDSAHPVRVEVTLIGSNGRSVNAILGMDAVNAAGAKVDPNGAVTKDGYSVVRRFNPGYPAFGQPAGTAGEVRSTVVCFASTVSRVFFEAYPKDTKHVTDRSVYGETVYQYADLHGKTDVKILLRLPLRYEYAAANGLKGAQTGNVEGTVLCDGKPMRPDYKQMRAWSSSPGWDCGLRSFSASADPTTTAHYTMSALAGGQCWAPAQTTRMFIRGNCLGHYMELIKSVDVVTGKTVRLDAELKTGRIVGPVRGY